MRRKTCRNFAKIWHGGIKNGVACGEEFLFHTAYELSGFSFENMLALLKEGLIKVDIRIGQHANGSPHDHGTGFRLKDRDLTRIFASKRKLL